MATYFEERKAEQRKEYDKKVKQLLRDGAEYLRLSASGMDVYTEWRTKEGTIARLLLP